ncbi:MAG: AraC family transcriptional regulator [Prevotella sp.]|nr:AraC family transcriptional regulator [Prevotella sp.]
MMRQTVHLILLAAVGAVMMAGCTGREAQHSMESQQPQDTVYTQRAAMAVYGYQPERALEIVDSAVIVGNISEVWADVNRARIYSQSQMKEQLDSLLGGPQGVRLDTARAIAERLLKHDSLKTNPKLHQDVLEILIYTARQQEDTVRWLQRSRELVSESRKHGAETKALRTEAELGASLCYSGQQELGLTKLDSVIDAIGSLEPFRFYELDAYIIAAKRKIGVLGMLGREEETLPLARRMIELLDDYEQHPDKYHDGSYREPKNDTKRADYIRFYRSQAQGFITAAYTALGDKGNMNEAYEKIERTVRNATAREHIARYNALQQQMETDRQRARADNIRLQAVGIFVIALLAIGFAVILLRKNRDIRQKNRILAQQLTELYDTGAPRQTGDGLASGGINEMSPEELYRHIRDEVIRLQLYTDPGFGRQSIIERFHLTKDQASRAFSQGSEHSSISDFINNCRLDHARRLLISRPDMSISDIATASGFGLRTTFTRNFKARHGLTPSEFREQQEQS